MSRRNALICLAVILAFSAAVRLVGLGWWPAYVFDEHYYAHDANTLLTRGLSSPGWRNGGFRQQSHPLLGQELIAVGIAAAGNDPWGWRLASAICGTVLVALIYPLARRMLLDRFWATIAAALVACDTLLVVQSRVAMLDGFVALWTVLAVYGALRAARARRHAVWWLAACGAALGLAVACKWSGALAIPAALAVLVSWGRKENRRPPALVVALVVLPLAVYLLTYLPYFLAGHGLSDWVHLQAHMARHGWSLHHSDVRSAVPAGWLSDSNPIWYEWQLTPGGLRALVAIGNPWIWWGGAVAVVLLAVAAVRKRSRVLALPVLLVLCLYLPWLATSRTAFLYYMAPIVPFLALALARALSLLRSQLAPLLAAPAVVPLAVWLPFLISVSVPYGYYEAVMVLPAWR